MVEPKVMEPGDMEPEDTESGDMEPEDTESLKPRNMEP